MNLRNILLLLGVFLFVQTTQAQVSGVNYKLKFNEKTNLFDCYLVIKDGNATTLRDRAQFNAQYTILVPTGSTVEMVKTYMPLQNNQNYTGFQPMEWALANSVRKPGADPFYDFVSIVPSLSPASFYNDLKEGDEVRLFSLKVTPITECGASVKLFDNGADLNSGSRGMDGGDFSNGFTMGGVQQKYWGNEQQFIPTLDVIQDVKKSTVNGIELKVALKDINLSAYTFEWIGPNGFNSSEKDVNIVSPKKSDFGTYEVSVMDERGCQQTMKVEVGTQSKNLNTLDKTDDQVNLNLANNESREKPIENLNVFEGEYGVKIYPNPASNFFNVSISGEKGADVKASITDINGRIIQANVITGKIVDSQLDSTIQLQELTPGIYNLLVHVNDKESTHRIIVIK
ncbi:MAG: T9SS type A sorting domain-containing protein [Saprospiraceae bacterium]|nr:T9SS type A sorting domain-containing protein [Saprospiraceae bacterium]